MSSLAIECAFMVLRILFIEVKQITQLFFKHIYSHMFSVVFLCKTVLRINIIYGPLLCFNIVSVVQ